ncbi:MAG: hypothetical protein GY711_19780 [bacterium]|nr:hypothetical protein [bacterium]
MTRPITTDPFGFSTTPFLAPLGLPIGTTVQAQYFVTDLANGNTAFSNAGSVTVVP